jgi:hypothetical protein
MARRAKATAPTPEQLTEDQRDIYESLPEDKQDKYLNGLPAIPQTTERIQKKLTQLQLTSDKCSQVIKAFQAHKKLIEEAKNGLTTNGTSTIREYTSPPEVPGVLIRFTREKKEGKGKIKA